MTQLDAKKFLKAVSVKTNREVMIALMKFLIDINDEKTYFFLEK